MAGQLQEETGWWEEGSSLDSWTSEGKGLNPTQSGNLPAPTHTSLEGELANSSEPLFRHLENEDRRSLYHRVLVK